MEMKVGYESDFSYAYQMTISAYSPELETQMRHFYRSLSEKERRRYAAIEATTLGYGGISYISRVFGCDRHTIRQGLLELRDSLPEQEKRIRRPGGGRKSVVATTAGLVEAFLAVLAEHTAGSPMDEKVKWTNLTRPEIVDQLGKKGFAVSVTVVKQLLEEQGYRPRQAFKSQAGKTTIPDRDEQFNNIARLKEEYHANGNPVMSMDVKKKN
jgi:hypothetical protein